MGRQETQGLREAPVTTHLVVSVTGEKFTPWLQVKLPHNSSSLVLASPVLWATADCITPSLVGQRWKYLEIVLGFLKHTFSFLSELNMKPARPLPSRAVSPCCSAWPA